MTSTEDLRLADYSAPTRNCDIVMKGGITSGVVYPHAVCELAQTYRFKNVGGTSAGAIAAAATAAAEYGRNRCGFGRLAALPAWIGAEGNLKSLFQPQPSTHRLFEILIAALEGGPVKACWTAIREHFFAFLCGALPGLVIIALAVARGFADGLDSPFVWIEGLAGLLLAVIGSSLVVCARIVRQVTRVIPDNGFGLCSGGPSSKSTGPAPLTPWLSDMLNELAGLPKGMPLTFGHLWAGPIGDREHPPDDPDERHLQLAMMTTNLVNRRAHQLPWDRREWFYDPSEFRELFPAEVVEWMEDHCPEPQGTALEVQESRMRLALMRPLLPLPAPADLPVVVATRMSLSFPVLLGAVPLWCVDMSREENNAMLDEWRAWARDQGGLWDPLAADPAEWPQEGQPASKPSAEHCWFSDGGISSNFPVHFFDRLIPRWPTFAINLRPFAVGKARDDSDQSRNTSMVKSNGGGIEDWWYRLPERPGGFGLKDRRLFAFLSSMIRTMQNRVDEAQMRVPGYRDRIAHVSMSEEEGGMNLTMSPATIGALTERGRAAARLLRDAYTPPDGQGQVITWDNHRWVRLRSSLAVLEQMHRHFAAGYSGIPNDDDERTYAELLARRKDEGPSSYRWCSERQRRLALLEIEAIVDAANAYNPEDSVAREAPNPPPQGRIAPRD